ncbi:hypothetical protein O6H91_11G090700 [Diphasiastrum complanatum]|uniref:Uncharacterized protein n=1 Tax=Diphasiastrum complanatum TaxID=34168 RepID=A0ACC2CBI9_DIPCM|nr:hypothetical protein O6H91_11G090700 [Diphasiastrum complanatum]
MHKRAIQEISKILNTLLPWPLFLHMIVALSAVWLAGYLQFNFLFCLLSAILYLHSVDSLQKERLKSQIQHRVQQEQTLKLQVTNTETATWFNVLLQESWPSWLERYLSKAVADCLLFNLNCYKPRAVHKLLLDRLRLGSSPPVVHSVKVFRNSNSGDHTILEIDVSFVAAEDMRLELAACLKKASVGLGMTAKFYGDNLIIKGKLRLGCKFVPYYPYVGELSVAFVSAPNLNLSVRPLLSNSVDVNDLPGIASWVSKALQAAMETCMVEPYPLKLDLIRMFGAEYNLDIDKGGNNKKLRPGIANDKREASFAIIEILEGKDLVAKDRSGFSDPYVKIKMDKIKFITSVKKQTLNPHWHEVFRIHVTSWHLPTKVFLRVRDRDIFGKDDELGWHEIDLVQLRGGDRHDMWLKLHDTKSGHLHVGVTVVEPVARSPQVESVPVGETASPSAPPVASGTHSGTTEVKNTVVVEMDAGVCPNCTNTKRALAGNVGISEGDLMLTDVKDMTSSSTADLSSQSTSSSLKKETLVTDNLAGFPGETEHGAVSLNQTELQQNRQVNANETENVVKIKHGAFSFLFRKLKESRSYSCIEQHEMTQDGSYNRRAVSLKKMLGHVRSKNANTL